MDNFLFADLLEFDEEQLENKTNSLFTLISPRRKNGKLSQSGIGENDVEFGEKKENLSFNDNNNDTKSTLTLVLDHIDSPPRQSTCNCTK